MRCFRMVFAAVLLCTGTAGGAEAVPRATAEQVLQRWLQAYNSGDAEQLSTVITQYRFDQAVARDLDLRTSMGPFRMLEMRSSTPLKAEAIVSVAASERALLLTVALEDADPVDVGLFQLEGVETPPAHRPGRMAVPALVEAAHQRLDALASTEGLSGAMAVAGNGEVLLQWQGGLADRAGAVPITPETRFRLASLNKMFTAVAVLQLVQAGKISLDDSIADHLTDYPDQQIARSITIGQLLNHTSGLGDIFGDDFSNYSQTLKRHTDYVDRFGPIPPAHVPGSQDGYSNYGFIVLGAIIEAVSGQSYYDYVEQHIYRVAGMTSTGSVAESVAVPGRAVGYTKVNGQWQVETASLPWRGTAAGGGYSTLGDMLKFGGALLKGTLLSPALLDAATSPQNHKAWYGYGFMVSGEGRARQYGHEGGAAGANAAFVVVPASGYVVIGLSNTDPDAMENAVNYVARRLPL